MTALDSFTWGSSPAIPVSFSYDYRRSGADMQYRIAVVIGAVGGGSYFGYGIGVSVNCGGVSVSHGLKLASTTTWSSEIRYTTDWITVRNKVSGTTALAVTLTTDAPRGNSIHSYTLTVTPAASDMTVPSFTLGSAGTIGVSKAAAGYTHTIVCTVGGASYTVCSKSSASSVSWTPPIAMAQHITQGTAASANYTITTYNGNTTLGSRSHSGTLYVPSSLVPAVSVERTPVNDQTTVASWGVAVKGYTRCRYAITAAGVQGASIVSCRTVLDGKSYTGADFISEVLETAGHLTSTVTVTDSRGRRTTVELPTLEVLEYAVPSLGEVWAKRCDANGAERTDGSYLKCLCTAACASAGGHNSVNCRVRWRSIGGTWGSYVSLTNGTAQVVGGGSVDARTSYEVEISAVDALGEERRINSVLPSDAVTVHLRPGGNGIAFGKYSEFDNTLECAWNAGFAGSVAIVGGLWVGNRSLLDWTHPVGSVYLSVNDAADPAVLFGGTWQSLGSIQALYAWKRMT